MQIPHPLPEKSAAPAIDPQWTILKILQWTTSFFTTHAIDSPRLTAEILLAHVLDARRIDLYLRFDQPLNAQELADYREVIKRRVRREPVAYITGTREFWGLDFTVSPDVLIPRPETEFIVEESIKLIPADAWVPAGGGYLISAPGPGLLLFPLRRIARSTGSLPLIFPDGCFHCIGQCGTASGR
ncbi:MAG: hypothetical protein R2874_08355 [Desulfobacterales bacterium]